MLSRKCELSVRLVMKLSFRPQEGSEMFTEEEAPASANGILQCLRLLAEEAATLNLQRTLWAIQDALETAEDESAVAEAAEAPEPRFCLH